jgi:hypothetical protein
MPVGGACDGVVGAGGESMTSYEVLSLGVPVGAWPCAAVGSTAMESPKAVRNEERAIETRMVRFIAEYVTCPA